MSLATIPAVFPHPPVAGDHPWPAMPPSQLGGQPESQLQPAEASPYEHLAKRILAETFQFRRVAGQPTCEGSTCPHCLAPHLPKLIHALESGRPVRFVLPAFPGKSPNPAKVLGRLPDRAEQCALEFLQHLCDRIRSFYAPGAEVILCSDGRVFADAVGLAEDDVSAYQAEITRLIAKLGLKSLRTFHLDDFFEGISFQEMRETLLRDFAEPMAALREKVRAGKDPQAGEEAAEALRMYLGITRFLFEDSLHPEQTRSRTSLQKDSRERAYHVIQRSNAWSKLVAKLFPEAVRLSIHPQVCGASKLGIRLMEAESWMTPWHGVAVDVGNRYLLLKRSQAESLGGKLVKRNGRPSHYVLPETALPHGASVLRNEV